MSKPVWFFVNVKVCAPIMVIGVGNGQMEIDLKEQLPAGCFQKRQTFQLCIIFITNTHSKSITDGRNEFTDLK